MSLLWKGILIGLLLGVPVGEDLAKLLPWPEKG